MKELTIKYLILMMGIAFIFLNQSCEYEQREEVDLGSLPEVVSFTTDIAPIFVESCIQCHKTGSTPPDLTLENSYLELTGGGYINTNNPAESKLYKAINGGGMTQYATDLDRAYILKWIEQGAEEN